MKKPCLVIATLALAVQLVWTSHAAAIPSQSLITVDENGNGTYFNAATNTTTPLNFLPSLLEPLSGMSTLAYFLPFEVNPGDVVLSDAGGFSDVLRFEPAPLADPEDPEPPAFAPLLYFFSNLPGTALADVGLPASLLTPTANLPEINGGALYIPDSSESDPGGIVVATNPSGLSYHFISDSEVPPPTGTAVPEPSVLALQACVVGAGVWSLLRRRGVASRG